jgi:hypothetical protein
MGEQLWRSLVLLLLLLLLPALNFPTVSMLATSGNHQLHWLQSGLDLVYHLWIHGSGAGRQSKCIGCSRDLIWYIISGFMVPVQGGRASAFCICCCVNCCYNCVSHHALQLDVRTVQVKGAASSKYACDYSNSLCQLPASYMFAATVMAGKVRGAQGTRLTGC